MPAGYFKRYLRIDLSCRAHETRPLEPSLLRDFIGGVGLGTALLTRETSAHFDPLGEEACMVFAFSPLVGSPVTTSAKFAVVAKSPLTGQLSDALSSSDFAIAGKRTGHDAIVLRGRAAQPSVVLIDHDEVRLMPCPELWDQNLTISEVSEQLEQKHPGFHFSVIGVAGERLVRFACLTNGKRHAGRGGLGAVLGGMQVKALGVRGQKPVPIADSARVVAIARDLAARSLGPATEKYRELGTVANLATFNRLAALPTRNFQQSTFEQANAISGEQLQATRAKGRSACRNCTIGCEHFFSPSSGGAKVKMEYESLFALSSLCGIGDPDITLRAARRCDEWGLDTISTGGSIAFVMECAERGLLQDSPWQNAPHFGDGEGLLQLIDDIAHQKGALGQLLALGSRQAAERIGPPAADFAAHVKGLELPGYEPRALQTMALGLAVNARGADHNRSGAYEADFSGKTDRFAPSPDAALLAIDTENRAALIDSLILCKFLRGVFDDLYQASAEMLEAITGEPYSAKNLRATAERIVLAKKMFNVREGWCRADDTLPKRFLTDPLPSGAATGAVVETDRLNQLIQAYYVARGWNTDGSVPTSCIEQNGLSSLL